MDVSPGHGRVAPSLSIPNQPGVGFNLDEAAIELKVELHRLDGGDLHLPFKRRGEGAVIRHPSADRSGQRGS